MQAAADETLRCGTDLVGLGDAQGEVLRKCGEPVRREALCAPGYLPGHWRPRGGGFCNPAEDWTYDPGYGQFITILRFKDGQLKTIRYGSRSGTAAP